MAIIQAGLSANAYVPAGQVLSVRCLGSATTTLTIRNTSGGATVVDIATSPLNSTFGPYSVDVAADMDATGGAVDFVVSPAVAVDRFSASQVGTLRLKQALPRVGCMGDSISLVNYTAATYSHPASGWLNWAQARLGQPWYFPGSNQFAVSGTTTDAIIAAQLAPVLASHAVRPISRMFISAGTNDTFAGQSTSFIKQNLATLFGSLIDAGITPVHIGILPRGNDGAITVAKRKNLQLNEWMEWYAYTKGGLEFVDCSSALANTANAFGNAVTTLTDGTQLHPIDPGGFYMGKVIADYYLAKGVGPQFRAANQAGDLYDATDNPTGIVSDAQNVFMTGGGAGTAPTGMTIQGGAAWTFAGTRTLDNGQTRPIGVLTGAASTSYFLYQDAVAAPSWGAGTRIKEGDYVYAQSEIVLTNTVNVTNMPLQIAESNGVTTVDSRYIADGTGGIPNVTGSLKLTLRSAPVLMRPYGGSGTASIINRQFVTFGGGGSGTVQVNSFELRRWVGEV